MVLKWQGLPSKAAWASGLDYLGGWSGRTLQVQQFETSLDNIARRCLKKGREALFFSIQYMVCFSDSVLFLAPNSSAHFVLSCLTAPKMWTKFCFHFSGCHEATVPHSRLTSGLFPPPLDYFTTEWQTSHSTVGLLIFLDNWHYSFLCAKILLPGFFDSQLQMLFKGQADNKSKVLFDTLKTMHYLDADIQHFKATI